MRAGAKAAEESGLGGPAKFAGAQELGSVGAYSSIVAAVAGRAEVAAGAVAIGALAIGRLIVRRAFVGELRLKRVRIDDLDVESLRVDRLTVRDRLSLPSAED